MKHDHRLYMTDRPVYDLSYIKTKFSFWVKLLRAEMKDPVFWLPIGWLFIECLLLPHILFLFWNSFFHILYTDYGSPSSTSPNSSPLPLLCRSTPILSFKTSRLLRSNNNIIKYKKIKWNQAHQSRNKQTTEG